MYTSNQVTFWYVLKNRLAFWFVMVYTGKHAIPCGASNMFHVIFTKLCAIFRNMPERV